MRRREFFALVGAAATWPLVVRAQQQALPVIGFLHYGSPDKLANLAEAVRRGLQETGYVDRQNVTILYRWAEGHYDLLPTLAAELVHRRVNVIVAGGNAAAHAAKNATAAIPVVFTSGADPVYSGLVTSLSRPEGNLTGSSIIAQAMGAKRLELIHELLPLICTVGMIINPKFVGAESEYEEVEAAGRAMKLQILRFTASNNDEVDTAFGTSCRRWRGSPFAPAPAPRWH